MNLKDIMATYNGEYLTKYDFTPNYREANMTHKYYNSRYDYSKCDGSIPVYSVDPIAGGLCDE